MSDISGFRAHDNSTEQLTRTFKALCEARAYHYGQGELTGIEAVDRLQDWALTRGLIDRIGQDAVQAIMAAAFLPYRED